MDEKKVLDEATPEFQELRKQWLAFHPTTEEELFQFIHSLTTEYVNDYGTCVRMTTALMSAVFWYMCEKEGFTGFQVGCMMWDVIRHIFDRDDKIGLCLQQYELLLYPQYDKTFNSVILDEKQLDILRDEAAKLLNEDDGIEPAPKVKERWEKLAAGWLPRFVKIKKGNN